MQAFSGTADKTQHNGSELKINMSKIPYVLWNTLTEPVKFAKSVLFILIPKKKFKIKPSSDMISASVKLQEGEMIEEIRKWNLPVVTSLLKQYSNSGFQFIPTLGGK